ncbi:MAG: hypothetical protein DRQ47_00795 [Gammaproteobacteria bacterium]|nr:MAG: hypothetical protein DRQ47_00795 [Gammaproteobacteria bacterium]
MSTFRLTISFILLISCYATNSQAEVISIADPNYQTPNSPAGILRPVNGMSMSRVEQQFGQPDDIVPPIGDPPITRWIYGDFSVFFEYSTVIQSVVPHEEP